MTDGPDAQSGIDALARLLALRDGYTSLHAERAAALASAVGDRLGLEGEDAVALTSAARLHDIGKVGIPDRILHKPERLEPDEWAIVRCHPAWGAEVLTGLPGLQDVATIVRFHHERWDGRGYPEGLAGQAIPLASRIIGACEAYSALTADRPFRAALSPAKAQQVLRSGAGTHFDERVIDAMLGVLADQPGLAALPAQVPPSPVHAEDEGSGVRIAAAGDGLKGLGPALQSVQLPALAESRQRLIALTEEAQPPVGRMIDVVETDPGLAAAVMLAARRADDRVTTVRDAVQALKPEAIAEVAHAVPVFDFFRYLSGGRIPPERFRLHAVSAQRAARRIASAIEHPTPGELALGALLHDVGKLVLAAATAGYPAEVHGRARTPEQRLRAERRELTLDHATAGAALLRRWEMPEAIAEMVDGHHDADRGRDAAVLRLADMLAHYSTGTPIDPGELLTTTRMLGLTADELRATMFDLHAPGSGGAGTPTREVIEPSPLTPRETDALRGLAGGGTYTEIAERIGLSPSTLRSHLHNVYGKLGVSDRAQAVLLATERGWLDP